jgi:antitoxin VapB
MNEFEIKQKIIQELLVEQHSDALLLQRVSSFAWATCGAASYINTASSDGLASLLITPSGRFLLTTNIEAPRLLGEEKLEKQGWEPRISDWYVSQDVIGELTRGLRLAADCVYPGAKDLSSRISRLRTALLPEENERFRMLGSLCSQAMNEAIREVKPGQTEFEIAGHLSKAAERRGVQAIVNLIATDERIYSFRHPLPTAKKMERYAMLVLCGRRWGLVCSITRLVYFGQLPDDLKRKQDAVAQVDATFILASRPGRNLGEVFSLAVAAYARSGFSEEWKLHHQGGAAGYEPREYIATAASTDIVAEGQSFAWNPSITGTKSEDTILVGAADNEVITEIGGWPVIPGIFAGKTIYRPAILQIT